MMSRTGFLLTVNEFSRRTVFSKNILEKIGFDVKIIQCIPNENKFDSGVLYNRLYLFV